MELGATSERSLVRYCEMLLVKTVEVMEETRRRWRERRRRRRGVTNEVRRMNERNVVEVKRAGEGKERCLEVSESVV